MVQREDSFGSKPTERPLIQELITTRYEDLDTGFNERNYATASKEGENIENLQLSDLGRKRVALFNSRTGHIGNLTKIRNRLMDLTKEDGAREDVLNGCRQFDEAWRKFVNVPENYLQLLREYYGGDPCVLDKTVKRYDEQMERKLNLDLSVKLWLEKTESGRVGIEANRGVVSEKASKDVHSAVCRSSSRLSSVSQKRCSSSAKPSQT